MLRSGKPAIADSSPHRLRQSISDTKLFWLPLQPPYTKSLHRRCRVNYENWTQIMFSLGGVLYKDNGSLNRFVEISKLIWNWTLDGWLPPVSCSNIWTLFSHNCQHHGPGSKRENRLRNNDKNVKTIQWEDRNNNTFAIGNGLSNPEGLNTGGSSSGTKHALIVRSGVALSC